MGHRATAMLEGRLGPKHALRPSACALSSGEASQWPDHEPAYGAGQATRHPVLTRGHPYLELYSGIPI